jgi:hypothetical protein
MRQENRCGEGGVCDTKLKSVIPLFVNSFPDDTDTITSHRASDGDIVGKQDQERKRINPHNAF